MPSKGNRTGGKTESKGSGTESRASTGSYSIGYSKKSKETGWTLTVEGKKGNKYTLVESKKGEKSITITATYKEAKELLTG